MRGTYTSAVKRAERAARKASALRIQNARQDAQRALAANRCPCCGSTVRRNSALSGWVQCAQFGADGFRLDSSRPSCNWQGFTE